MTLQAALKEMENLFKNPKDKKANTQMVINELVTGIETLLDIMIITSQDERENNQENPNNYNNNVISPFNKGKAKSNKP